MRGWTTIKQLRLNVTGKTLRVGKERQRKAFHSNLFFSEIQEIFSVKGAHDSPSIAPTMVHS